METTATAAPARQEFDLGTAPPIWWDHRDKEPNRPISYAIVTINAKRVGRIDRPQVLGLDRDMLQERFPQLYDHGEHDVRLDFRAARGRGALGIITTTFGEAPQQWRRAPEAPPEARAPQTPASALVDWAGRVMQQNERLQKMLLEATQSQASNSMDSHERLIAMMASSMERDRTRQSDWLEREAQLRAAVYERAQSTSADAADQQARLLETIGPMMASQGGSGGPFMAQIQEAMMEKVAGTIMEKIEGITEGGASDPMTQLLQAAGPLLAQKLGGGGDPGPAPPVQ